VLVPHLTGNLRPEFGSIAIVGEDLAIIRKMKSIFAWTAGWSSVVTQRTGRGL